MANEVVDVTFVGSYPAALPDLDLPEVAFAGRSNVGKSSAINCMLARKAAARVSSRPGRTQTINLFRVDEKIAFADLPGYGFAHVPAAVQDQWKGMIESYLANRESLRLVVVLVDARRKPQEMDGMLLYGLADAGIPVLVVATKVDKLKRNERSRNLAAIKKEFRLDAEQLVAFSSVNREGRDQVWRLIRKACR